METGNIFVLPNQDSPDELIENLVETACVSVEKIVSRGQQSPAGFWYDQKRHELVILLTGKAVLEFADPQARIDMKSGDYLVIPAHCRHRVAWTDPEVKTLWIAIHYENIPSL